MAFGSLRWAIVYLQFVFVYIGHVTVCAQNRRPPEGGRCKFPAEWRGRYFQSGLGEIIIRDKHFTTKGTCIEHERDYFLLHNRDQNCYHCLLLLRQHNNVIQYKESYCTTLTTLKVVCSQIRVETPLYTLIREPASAVRCPFNGAAYYFAYNDLVHGSCPQALSYAQPCAGNSRYQLRFNHCVEHAMFNGRDLGLECLATWKDGSETYVYGRLRGNGIDDADKEERYRCFKYHHYGSELMISMSADATCRGLRSATDGPFLMEFTRDTAGWPDQSCQFPDWLEGVRWRDLDGQSRYSINDEAKTFSVHAVTSSKQQQQQAQFTDRSEFRCRQNVAVNANEVTVYTFAVHNCMAKYQCLKFRRLAEHAVEFYQGNMVDHDSSFRCQTEVYDNVQLLIPDPLTSLASCPRPGVHHTAPSDGCIHRLTVGCHNESTVDISHSCTDPGQPGITLECLVTWSDSAESSFVVARHQQTHVIDCFSFRRESGLTVFGPDSRCGGNSTTRRHDVLQYSILRNDNCRRGPDVRQPIQTQSTLTTIGRRPALATSTTTAASGLVERRVVTSSIPPNRNKPRLPTPPTTRLPFSIDDVDDDDLDYGPERPRPGIRFADDDEDDVDDDDDDDDDNGNGGAASGLPPRHHRERPATQRPHAVASGNVVGDRIVVGGGGTGSGSSIDRRKPSSTRHPGTGDRAHQRHAAQAPVTSSSGLSRSRSVSTSRGDGGASDVAAPTFHFRFRLLSALSAVVAGLACRRIASRNG